MSIRIEYGELTVAVDTEAELEIVIRRLGLPTNPLSSLMPSPASRSVATASEPKRPHAVSPLAEVYQLIMTDTRESAESTRGILDYLYGQQEPVEYELLKKAIGFVGKSANQQFGGAVGRLGRLLKNRGATQTDAIDRREVSEGGTVVKTYALTQAMRDVMAAAKAGG